MQSQHDEDTRTQLRESLQTTCNTLSQLEAQLEDVRTWPGMEPTETTDIDEYVAWVTGRFTATRQAAKLELDIATQELHLLHLDREVNV